MLSSSRAYVLVRATGLAGSESAYARELIEARADHLADELARAQGQGVDDDQAQVGQVGLDGRRGHVPGDTRLERHGRRLEPPP